MNQSRLVRVRIPPHQGAEVEAAVEVEAEISEELFQKVLNQEGGYSMSASLAKLHISVDWLRDRMEYANSRKDQLRKVIMDREDKEHDRALWDGYIQAIREVARHLGVEKELFLKSGGNG